MSAWKFHVLSYHISMEIASLRQNLLLRYSTFGVGVDVKCLSVVKMSDNYIHPSSAIVWRMCLPITGSPPEQPFTVVATNAPILNLTFVCHQYILWSLLSRHLVLLLYYYKLILHYLIPFRTHNPPGIIDWWDLNPSLIVRYNRLYIH